MIELFQIVMLGLGAVTAGGIIFLSTLVAICDAEEARRIRKAEELNARMNPEAW